MFIGASKERGRMVRMMRWLISRVGIIYLLVFLFAFICIDFKMLSMRVKTRRLNDSIPNFSDMILYSRDPSGKHDIDWKPYKDYFELVLRYIPDDIITKELLGYVDYNFGKEDKAIGLLKSSAAIKGRYIFWPNYNLGVIYYKKQMWPQAAEYLFKAVQANPQLTLYLMQGTMVYKQIFASPFFKYSLNDEISKAQSQAYILLLSCLYKMGQYEKLVYVADLAIANPALSYKDAFYYYAAVGFYQQHQVQKAFMLMEKSLDFQKDNPDVYYYMADMLERMGQLDQARALIQTSYALHQKNDPRFPYEARINLQFF